MKAMIFAAGLGTRLRPITDNQPKALVTVNGIAMIDRALNNVRAAGATTIVVNVHHHADMLINHLKDYDDVMISDERECLLDTGGGVVAARTWLDGEDDIVLCNADILTDVDMSSMVSRHIASGADATLLVERGRDSSRKLLFDNSGMMRGWINEKLGCVRPEGVEVSKLIRAAFGGIHVISPALLPTLEEYASEHGKVFSITSFYIDVCHNLKFVGYSPKQPYQWYDIGSLEKLERARSKFID